MKYDNNVYINFKYIVKNIYLKLIYLNNKRRRKVECQRKNS
jgi:hypothetical protein